MQQSTDVIDMMTVCNEKIILPVSYEKITLFRHAILLPKITHHDTFQSSIGQSSSFLPHFLHQRGNNDPDSPALQTEKDKEDMIETP